MVQILLCLGLGLVGGFFIGAVTVYRDEPDVVDIRRLSILNTQIEQLRLALNKADMRVLEVERKYARKFAENESLKEKFNELLKSYQDYIQFQQEKAEYKSHGPTQTINVDRDIKDAIKKAMMYSHPDKGGNSEEFIRFKKLYDKYR